MKKDIFELFAPCISDHLQETVYQNDEYRKSVQESAKILEQLRKRLEPEGEKLLDDYFIAEGHTAALCEELVYTQGMKDLLALLSFLTA